MSRATRLVNTALTRAYAKSHATLLSGEPLLAGQMRLLSSIVKANVRSEFGRAHGFDSIASIEAFRAAVPLSRWDDYAAAADRVAAGQQGVLTSERVRLLEPSSGSTAATKLVPYTATLSRQFRAGIEPWLHDLYTSFPGLTATRSYWSVTPAATHPKRQSVVPIGFDDDADYLGPLAGRLINNVFAVSLIYTAIYSPFAVMLLRTYFLAVPKELEEAALIDGATHWQVFSKVMLPIVSPGILTVALIIGLYSWNEFLIATTFLQRTDRLTAVVSFFLLSGQYTSDWGEIMAAALIIVLPVIVLFIALQRYVPESTAQFEAGDYTASLQTLAILRAPVDAFFDDVMVNAEQLDLRLNRQGLLKMLHQAMNRVGDLSRLAV